MTVYIHAQIITDGSTNSSKKYNHQVAAPSGDFEKSLCYVNRFEATTMMIGAKRQYQPAVSFDVHQQQQVTTSAATKQAATCNVSRSTLKPFNQTMTAAVAALGPEVIFRAISLSHMWKCGTAHILGQHVSKYCLGRGFGGKVDRGGGRG